MAVYRKMDIGTAKPTQKELNGITLHLIDLVEPSENYTVTEFQRAADEVLSDIDDRGNRALLVGGTGLYLRALLGDLHVPGRWPEIAEALENEADRIGTEPLFARLAELDPLAATRIEPGNKRRLLRALEVTIGSGSPFSSFGPGLCVYPPSRVVQIGIPYVAEVHDDLIRSRFLTLMDRGLLGEVGGLAASRDGISRTARQAIGYKELLDHLENGADLDQAIEQAIRRTKTLARRQWSWFRRDPRIDWLDPSGDLFDQVLSRWDAVPADEDGWET